MVLIYGNGRAEVVWTISQGPGPDRFVEAVHGTDAYFAHLEPTAGLADTLALGQNLRVDQGLPTPPTLRNSAVQLPSTARTPASIPERRVLLPLDEFLNLVSITLVSRNR